MKTFVGTSQWLVFFLIGLVINFIILPIVAYSYIGLPLSLALGGIIFLLVSIFAIVRGYRFFYNHPDCVTNEGKNFFAIPAKHAVILLVNGQEKEPFKSGYYFVFPFLSLVVIQGCYFLGDFPEEIFDNSVDNRVEFFGGISAPVKGIYVCRIINNNADIIKYALQEDADDIINNIIASLVRTALGSMDIETARKLRLKLKKVRKQDKDLFDSISTTYGIEIVSIKISDIELSDEEIEINRIKFRSEIDLKIADNRAEEMRKLAEGKADATKLEGRGLADKIQHMRDQGVDHGQIMNYLQEELKWLNIGDKTVVIDNGGGLAGIIAQVRALGL